MEQSEYKKKLERLSEKTRPKIEEFTQFLRTYPYLGASHPVGKHLIKDIQSLGTISIQNEEWYRARKVSESKIYTHKDMEPPPPDAIITEGRFNHYGQQHFYLSNSPTVGAIESSHDKPCISWIQKVIINSVQDILDLTGDYEKYYNSSTDPKDGHGLPLSVVGLLLAGSITEKQRTRGSWKPEYFVPRFIADVCKHSAIKGIKYPSALTYGTNLVIFDFGALNCTFSGEPYLFEYNTTPPQLQ